MPDVNNAFLNNGFIYRNGSWTREIQSAKGVKIATPDLLIEDEMLSLESMTDFVFAEIGGQELLSTTRHDLVDSPFVESNTIRDAGQLFRKTKYVEPVDGITNIFSSFQVEINSHVPDSITDAIAASGLQLSNLNVIDNIYSRKDDGSVYIVLKNLKTSHRIEISFVSIEDLSNGTIY